MKLIILRKMAYCDTFIYVFQYGFMFQYLFSWNNEIYQDHIFLKPKWYNIVRSWFGRALYTREQLDEGEKIVLSGAMKSIDVLYEASKGEPIPICK